MRHLSRSEGHVAQLAARTRGFESPWTRSAWVSAPQTSSVKCNLLLNVQVEPLECLQEGALLCVLGDGVREVSAYGKSGPCQQHPQFPWPARLTYGQRRCTG